MIAVPFDFDPRDPVYLDSDAKRNYYPSNQLPKLPDSHWMIQATDCYQYDGGSFNGMIWYWAGTLPDTEACFDAMRNTAVYSGSIPTPEQMLPWSHSQFKVVMDGPAHYHADLKTELWDVTTIQNGLFFEHANGDRRMSFWAIDLDKNRYYYHYESGGFPDDRYVPYPEAQRTK
ncbi:MAG: hypothetical protein R3C17_21970 [Planctomycetaceae bacterium]